MDIGQYNRVRKEGSVTVRSEVDVRNQISLGFSVMLGVGGTGTAGKRVP